MRHETCGLVTSQAADEKQIERNTTAVLMAWSGVLSQYEPGAALVKDGAIQMPGSP